MSMAVRNALGYLLPNATDIELGTMSLGVEILGYEPIQDELVSALRYALRFMPPSADCHPIHQVLDKVEKNRRMVGLPTLHS